MSSSLPDRFQEPSRWYQEIIRQAELAEHGPTRGAMVIRPYGYSLWEQIRDVLDRKIREKGHVNAYFPLLIPQSYFSKEADHVSGFAKECAVVTHYRLKHDAELGRMIPDPEAVLEEPLVVRPTSEAVIWSTYKQWIRSYRDLPLRINQWANVVRWEMRTRLFLRTSEILWQEGHTAHASAREAHDHALDMLHMYDHVAREYLALAPILGVKPAHEKFAGAVHTYTLEVLTQECKALQLGTSHFLGQNFAQAFGVTFDDEQGKREHVWGTSWGVTTRLIGAMVLTHADAKGLRLPPRVAPIQVVIVPVFRADTQQEELLQQAQGLYDALTKRGVRAHVDRDTQQRPGWKFAQYECQGVPIRLVIGPKDLEQGTCELTPRTTLAKQTMSQQEALDCIEDVLEEIQRTLYEEAVAWRTQHTHEAHDLEALKKALGQEQGWVWAPWDGTLAQAEQVQDQTGATIRCLSLPQKQEGTGRVLWSKAY